MNDVRTCVNCRSWDDRVDSAGYGICDGIQVRAKGHRLMTTADATCPGWTPPGPSAEVLILGPRPGPSVGFASIIGLLADKPGFDPVAHLKRQRGE